MSLFMLLIVLLIVAAVFGSWGRGQPWGGPFAWSPLGLVLVILLILWLTGNLNGLGHVHRWR
jgi:hypothetical protein